MINTVFHKCVPLGIGFAALCIAHAVHAVPAQYPLFVANPVTPIMMLNMSNDHQLFFKVYDDYGDLMDQDDLDNPDAELDGEPDTTYVHGYDYYGYFDSETCYVYQDNRFEPSEKVNANGYCSGKWNGNFLNWATMTRMDAIRKILYGGLRSTDTDSVTVLERAFLPHDAHSFAKFYDGTDIDELTPFTVPELQTGTSATGITICNTTKGGSALSQNVTSEPLLRVAKGNYMLWASNERWQCRWRSEMATASEGRNGNDSALTGLYSYPDSPVNDHKLGTGSSAGEFYARVRVCKSGMLESNCTVYPDGNYKPTGLLQKYGEPDDGGTAKINFGLLTGSYKKNKSGGVLRRTIGNMDSEIKDDDGTFTGVDGIVKTLNTFRIYGYRYDNGTYHDGWGSDDNCEWGDNSFNDGSCTNWGNPQAEIYLESLRYLISGEGSLSPTADYVFDNNDRLGIPKAGWGTAPVNSANYCAPLNVIQFNASTTSYDWDQLSGASDIFDAGDTLDEWTNKIASASHENLTGSYFIGSDGGSEDDELCTAKSIENLSDVRGTCPDAPRLEGSYKLAGLAYYARQNDLMNLQGRQSVRTFGVALAPALPKMTVPVPGSDTKKVTIIPACQNTDVGGNCAIVDFKIASQQSSPTKNEGILYVNWEDSEQGGDYDQDMWGVIKYEVTSANVKVTTQVMAQSTGDAMGFGYIISGTSDGDGFRVHSGVNGYTDGKLCTNDAGSRCTCRNDADHKACTIAEARSQTYSLLDGASSAEWLESPLYYAAKWGGYSKAFEEDLVNDLGTDYSNDKLIEAIKDRDITDSYYFATDPRELEESLDKAFSEVAATTGSASSVATNSTRLTAGSFVYQAQFNSENWAGTLNAFTFNENGELQPNASETTDDASMHSTPEGRKIITYNNENSTTNNFSWGNLNDAQKDALILDSEGDDEANAQKRVDWLRGIAAVEDNSAGFRERGEGKERNILGDIVNSSPAYMGGVDYRYHLLPPDQGGDTYRAHVKDKRDDELIFVGANDGMVHAFNADDDPLKDPLKEVFAYIPNMVFPKLADLTRPGYGRGTLPHQFIVDGPITVGDVFINDDWRSIIVGTLGAGGRGVYALDVTDPANPSVLFELDETDFPDLGYVMGKPLIVPLPGDEADPDGSWVAVFGNGDSSGGTSKLFVVDIEDTKKTVVIDTEDGTGLSAPAILTNSIGQGIAAYAGDLSGKLWKFDLVNSKPSPKPLFEATDASGIVQPITAAPTLGINSSKGDGVVMVYFGTGKYYDDADKIATATPRHSFYAIADIGSPVTRGTLFEKTLKTDTKDPFSDSTREVEQDESLTFPDWSSKNGWYLDFTDTDGERITTKPILIADKLIFPTLVPSNISCEYGGRSWLMEVVAVGDKFVGQKVLENIIPNDFLVLGDLGFGLTPSGGVVVGSGSDATLFNEKANPPPQTMGRQSWRQLR